MENIFLVLKSNFESYPLRSFSILLLIISFTLMKMRGGLTYPLTNSGRSILKLVKFASTKYRLNRKWSIWNILHSSDHSILMRGMINGIYMEIIFSNQAMYDIDPRKNASKFLNSNVNQSFAGKMTVIKKIKGKETNFISRDNISHNDLEEFLSA